MDKSINRYVEYDIHQGLSFLFPDQLGVLQWF